MVPAASIRHGQGGTIMIDVHTAEQLLDFGARIGHGPRAREQLAGAVAVHNILRKHRVAYLADEVGMGKTYVALGALALFRHYQPDFRVLVIAPRENIQKKWIKELTNFARHNVRYPDLRVVSIDHRPARPMKACDSLMEFVREVSVDPRRDFFLRLSSFSLSLGSTVESWYRLRDDLRKELPWLPDKFFDLRKKSEFKTRVAQAICCAMPEFDLVIVDEGHNLKHGLKSTASRNIVIAHAFGHPYGNDCQCVLGNYGPRAKRVLFLSATPLEESYLHIWNQLDVFGHGTVFEDLRRDDIPEVEKKRLVAEFLIRRVTTVTVAGTELTKNQYRREWRRGGLHSHDDPIRVEDDRQRLVVALVQKKVAELLGSEKFNRSFQIGMLASFESFLETARVKSETDEQENVFDDLEQTEDLSEREGIDVHDVNRITRDYRNRFGREMPHPKMDAVVEGLSRSWVTGTKSLLFVRRVASVKELKRKLDERYDDWLIRSLRERLPEGVYARYDHLVEHYRAEKKTVLDESSDDIAQPEDQDMDDDGTMKDRGGTDTFFAWFFRGDGPPGVISGANIQRRFIQRGTAYATFFEDNHTMALLGARPGSVLNALADVMGVDPSTAREEVRHCAAKYLSQARRLAGADRMEAAQAAAMEILKDLHGEIGEYAGIIWHERYKSSQKKPHASEAPDVSEWLERPTFFTELRQPDWALLREKIWPEPSAGTWRERFREQELRAQLLASDARLGHAFIDMYALTIQRIGSLDHKTLETASEENESLDLKRIQEYLDLLDRQRCISPLDREWGAFDELAAIGVNYDLIRDVNLHEISSGPLVEVPRKVQLLFRRQVVAGVTGSTKDRKTVVQQFRMPGYPLVLITTDMLQEGEDLHTFCSSVHHYGISWTPSSMEQRIGRIDRVRSQTDRRLSVLSEMPGGEDLLQVYFPYLEDTVEILQVQRVLERMNTFLRLMHEDLTIHQRDERHIDVVREIIQGRRIPEVIREPLKSAFPIPLWALKGSRTRLAVGKEDIDRTLNRFHALIDGHYDGIDIKWEPSTGNGILLGTVRLATGRGQPFALLLRSEGEFLVIRCISPVGLVDPERTMEQISESVATRRVRLGALMGRDEKSYDLTVEDDVMLRDTRYDTARVTMLIRRVTEQADILEDTHLPGEDRGMKVFSEDLGQEGNHDEE